MFSDPRKLLIKDFTYDLPNEKIATHPLVERDSSQLLIYKAGEISSSTYQNIAAQIPAGALIIFNDTRVVEARLIFHKTSGASIEIFCLEPDVQYPDMSTALGQQQRVFWKCLIGGASKWKHGESLQKIIKTAANDIIVSAKYIEKQSGYFIIELSWTPVHLTFAEILHEAGAIPLPPYIKRVVETADAERYQTVYADAKGSVAAPTAGLHFTQASFNSFIERNIETAFVTLHVGAGTFIPVKAAMLADHQMHAESFTVSKETIESLIDHADGTIVASGTTSLRTIESLYWLGVKLATTRTPAADQSTAPNGIIELGQWEPYDMAEQDMTGKEALSSLVEWLNNNQLKNLHAKTSILIAPPYQPKIAKALITNFHQPQSTLLLLVAAVVGNDWKKIYNYALSNDYRFLSYGDGSLLWFN